MSNVNNVSNVTNIDWNKVHLYKCLNCGSTTTYPDKKAHLCCGKPMRRMD